MAGLIRERGMSYRALPLWTNVWIYISQLNRVDSHDLCSFLHFPQTAYQLSRSLFLLTLPLTSHRPWRAVKYPCILLRDSPRKRRIQYRGKCSHFPHLAESLYNQQRIEFSFH